MLKSTYKPSSNDPPPPQPQDPYASFLQYSSVPKLSDPAVANAFIAQYAPTSQQQAHGTSQQHGRGAHRGGPDGRTRPRPQPLDKPKSKIAIPGCEPWLLVYTKYGRRFAYNPTKNTSYWRIPEKIMKGVLELDIKGIKEKVEAQEEADPEKSKSTEPREEGLGGVVAALDEQTADLGSDYEEVEVTDDELDDEEGGESLQGDDGDSNRQPFKRQRTDEATDDVPMEFNEDDIAYQLQAMGADYGLDPGEYDDGNPDAWPEGAEGIPLSEADARELFKDLLNDSAINPYSPWEKLIEDGRIIEDSRYTALDTTKARRNVWEEWSREQIQILKEKRAKEEKRDPRIPYLAFLQQKATPKLYWPEFRRKHKKEGPMKDTSLSDRDREKWYREHINRLKLPQDALKKDLMALLRSIPTRLLNNKTLLENIPSQVLADIRYISLDPKIRDAMIDAYIRTLGPPPTEDAAEEDEATRKAREDRRKREKALEERERVVAEEKRRQKRQLEYGRAALREEERELEKAMSVGKKGLQSQLLSIQAPGEKDGP